MIRSEQTNKLTLFCDECGKKAVFKDEFYRAKDFSERDAFGEKGNYVYATKVKGWSIIKTSCRCPNCKGKPRSKK